jgi:hypothetical protein
MFPTRAASRSFCSKYQRRRVRPCVHHQRLEPVLTRLADLSNIKLPSTPHLLLLTGTHPVQEKRQERPFPTRPSASSSSSASSPSSTSDDSDSNSNSTIPTGGPLLQRVQILTTPIITGFLITFLIFMPIIAFGIWSLAGIQVPPRMMEISKGMVVSKDKKDN